MLNALKALLNSDQYSVLESFLLPSRAATYGPIPRFLFDSTVGTYLQETLAPNPGLWLHQSLALEKLGAGSNVVVSTSTASGKSLIFRSIAFHKVLKDPSSRILVFYPLKALAADQLRGWHAMARALGMSETVVGRIDGSVLPAQARDPILESSRIILMTPDICHAWLMSRLAMPIVKTFLKDLSLIVMDEAHTLEGAFGSNFAFLLRRIFAARQSLFREASAARPLQLFASTATISNAPDHMKALTGHEFDSADENDDGSPQSQRLCAHIAPPEGQDLLFARTLQSELLKNSAGGGFITFVDSRKGVELLARASDAELKVLLEDARVMPYRAGYDSVDREAIERRLQSGQLRGVISTSALELGIDLPHLTVGLNIGVPATRKAYRQRLGRVGRASDGAFLVVAPRSAFARYGTSFREYHDMSVEPSYLYLDNRFMQFAHARCIVDELEDIGVGATLPPHGNWPKGYSEVFAAAKPGGNRPSEFDAIAQLGGDTPQRSYPLRNVGEINFKISIGENTDPFGEVNESQALRECYPGAIYLHMSRAYEVVSWHTNGFVPYIRVKPTSPARQTRPRIKTWINAGITAAELMEDHLLISADGFLAECKMQITERVEGYTDLQSGEYRAYQDLRQRNPNLRPRIRNFRTSGVILSINGDWFKKSESKQWIADSLTAVFVREYSVLPQDIGSAATNISVRDADGGGLRGNCIAVYDQVYGSLRLTERLYLQFAHLLDRLEIAAAQSESEGPDKSAEIVRQLKEAYRQFCLPDDSSISAPPAPDSVAGYIQVFAPDSRVCLREKGKNATDVQIIQPAIMEGKLMYQVQCPPRFPGASPVRRWVAANFVEPSANSDEWSYASWNTETESYEEPTQWAHIAIRWHFVRKVSALMRAAGRSQEEFGDRVGFARAYPNAKF